MKRKIVLFLVAFLLNLNSLSAGKNTVISILNFNDAHEISPVLDKLGERGGAARLKTVVDQLRRENPQTLVTFSGDLAGGKLFGGVFQGFPMVEVFNQLPIDIAGFGQHDFDFGAEIHNS